MAQPALAEVRVSCPACGGAIHPIAGRCKHCKADLVAARGGATAAIGSVIQLGALAPAPSGPAPGLPSGPPTAAPSPASGLPAVATAAPPPVMIAQPLVAPRRASWRRRWPLLVAALAAVAIVVSVAVLVFGGEDPKARRRRALGPAPDRMQTDQLPTDPWKGSGRAPDPDQLQPVPQAPPPDIDPGGGAPQPPRVPTPPAAGGGSITSADEFVTRAVDVGCQRLATCWGGPSASGICEELKQLTASGLAMSTGCPQFDPASASQCVNQLASLPCPDSNVQLPELLGMVAGLDACMRTCQE
ncbi:MAG: hypothetical protein IPL61_09185 [Myxococcales bacterium]|nr:hypothetical protein [Myxococcales bacterium]